MRFKSTWFKKAWVTYQQAFQALILVMTGQEIEATIQGKTLSRLAHFKSFITKDVELIDI